MGLWEFVFAVLSKYDTQIISLLMKYLCPASLTMLLIHKRDGPEESPEMYFEEDIHTQIFPSHLPADCSITMFPDSILPCWCHYWFSKWLLLW